MRIENGIIEIIEGRLLANISPDDRTTYIRLCQSVNKTIKTIQSKSSDVQIFDAFKKMLEYDYKTWREAYPDTDRTEYDTISVIKPMYKSFEKQYENGADEEERKSDFALCICSSYRKITNNAREESETILEMMQEAGIVLPKELSEGKEEK